MHNVNRWIVTGLVIALAVLIWVTAGDLGQIPATVENRFALGPLHLVYAAYAGIIALFVGWKASDRREGRHLSLMISFWGLALALSIVPSGDSSTLHKVAFGGAWLGALFQSFRFWIWFPHRMEVDQVRGLLATEHAGLIGRANQLSAWTVQAIMGHLWGKVLLSVFLLGFTLFLVLPGTHTYSMVMSTLPVDDSPLRLTLALAGAAALLANTAFAWTSFRLADTRERASGLWVVFAYVFMGAFSFTTTSLSLLSSVTGSAVIQALMQVANTAFQPVTTFVLLTAFALAVFHFGALDLKPLVSRTTLYGGLFVALTFVFALVEEFCETLLTTQLGLPEGSGTWIGAGAVAVAMGPLRAKLDTSIKGLGERLTDYPTSPGTAGAPGAVPEGAPEP